MAEVGTITEKERIDLYKMEYEQCVSLYRNLYEEVWKIFSYLAAISAAILVFGREYFSVGITISISMLPLLFWFLGVYVPLDRYGNMRSDRLEALERQLREKYQVDLQHFTLMAKHPQWKLRHEKYGLGWRVRHAAWGFFLLVFLVFCLGLVQWRCNWPLAPRTGATRVQGQVEIKGALDVRLQKPASSAPSKGSTPE